MLINTVPAQQLLGAPPPAHVTLPPGDLHGVVVVQVSGEIDLHTGPHLRETLRVLMPPLHVPPRVGVDFDDRSGRAQRPGLAGPQGDDAPMRAVVVDLTEVTFMDSFAVGVLIHGHHLARPGGRGYVVVATNRLIHDLFAVTGLAKVMPLHPDVATAVTHLYPASP